MEAVLNLKRFPTNDILLTCADIPLEGDLEKFNDSPYLPYSFSLLISGDESAQNRISFDYEPVSGVEKSGKIPDVLEFYNSFLNGDSVFFKTETSDLCFSWRKQI